MRGFSKGINENNRRNPEEQGEIGRVGKQFQRFVLQAVGVSADWGKGGKKQFGCRKREERSLGEITRGELSPG